MNTIYALWLRNIKAFIRDRTLVIASIVFPFFFVYVFGAIFSNEHIENPLTYMLAGVIVATVFDCSIRISSSTINDMASGFMKEVLVSPVSRISVVAGQFLSAATVASIQGITIFVIGFFIGFRVTSVFTVVAGLAAMVFMGIVFSGLGLFLATKTRTIQAFQIVSMAITMPMTFTSGAYVPVDILPMPLVIMSYVNPMTYAVSLFRIIALEQTGLPQDELIELSLAFQVGNFAITPFISLLILLLFGLVFIALSSVSFINTDFSKMNRNKADAIDW